MSINVIKPKKSTLFSHLILFDFFFFDSSAKHSLLHFGTFPVSGVNKKIYILNLIEQFKSFKQFFRLLQFLQKSKQKKSLNILIPSEGNAILLQQMLKLRFQTQIITSFAKQKNLSVPLKMILLLDYPTIRPMHVLNSITRNKFSLVQTINSFFELNSSGYYKICNNLTNLKRLIFIGVLLKQILK